MCWTHPAKDSCHPKNRFIGVLGVVMALKFPVLTWIGAPVHRRNRNGFNIDFAAVVESKQAKGCKKHGLYLWCLVVWKWRFDESFRAVETFALLSGTCRLRVCVSFLHWNYWQYIVLITFMFYFQKNFKLWVQLIVWGLSKYQILWIWHIISHLFDTHDITLLFHLFDIVNIITNIFQRFFSQLLSVIWFFSTNLQSNPTEQPSLGGCCETIQHPGAIELKPAWGIHVNDLWRGAPKLIFFHFPRKGP